MTNQFKQLTRVLAKSFGLDSDDLIASFRLACREDIPQVSDLRRRVLENEIKSGIHALAIKAYTIKEYREAS